MECGEQESEEIEEDEEDGMEEENGTDEEEKEKDEDEEKGECVNEGDAPWNQMHCKYMHAVENSSRFSLRVMEAMRSLQTHENVLPISSVEDIVDYIAKNYNNDGDLHAQVRTGMKQLCAHRFVVEVLKDEYQLIGPFSPSAMLETCSCEVDRSNSIYASTPKRTKLRKRFNKKFKRKSRCHCGKLQDEPKLDRNMLLSRMGDSNNTMLALPKSKMLRSKLKDNNIKIHSMTENVAVREKSNYNIRDNHDNNRGHTPKHIRKTNNDAAAESRSIEQYEKANSTATDQINENPGNSIVQGIKNLFPTRSKTREKELKRWIQRCRRECERQKKND